MANKMLVLRKHLLKLFQLLIMCAGHVIETLPVGMHFLLQLLRQLLHTRHTSQRRLQTLQMHQRASFPS